MTSDGTFDVHTAGAAAYDCIAIHASSMPIKNTRPTLMHPFFIVIKFSQDDYNLAA